MAVKEPVTEFDGAFSSAEASATPWEEARGRLEEAEVFWLSTVRPDGRPHVTPLIAVWFEGALHFCTGPDERKARNLEGNPHVVMTTGSNTLHAGLDLVVEGRVRQVEDETRLRRLAELFESKYGGDWHFEVEDGVFVGEGTRAVVFEVLPAKAFGFGKGEVYSQTRWRF